MIVLSRLDAILLVGLSVWSYTIIVLSYMIRLMTIPTKWFVRPVKTQISLGIRPVWSESSLSAWRKLVSLSIHWAHSKDSDQADPSLLWAHSHFVGFIIRLLISLYFGKMIQMEKETSESKTWDYRFVATHDYKQDVTNEVEMQNTR